MINNLVIPLKEDKKPMKLKEEEVRISNRKTQIVDESSMVIFEPYSKDKNNKYAVTGCFIILFFLQLCCVVIDLVEYQNTYCLEEKPHKILLFYQFSFWALFRLINCILVCINLNVWVFWSKKLLFNKAGVVILLMQSSCILAPLYNYNYEVCRSYLVDFPIEVTYTLDAVFFVFLCSLAVYIILPEQGEEKEPQEINLEDEEVFTPQCWISCLKAFSLIFICVCGAFLLVLSLIMNIVLVLSFRNAAIFAYLDVTISFAFIVTILVL